MQHPGAVDLVDGPRYRRHQLDRDTHRQRAGDAFRQASPRDQIEDEVETAVLFTRLVELDDVGMADSPDRPRLAKPAPAILRTDPDARADDLDGHAAGQLRLPRLIDDPHSTSPKLALDHETGDRGVVLRLRQSCGAASQGDGRINGQPFQNILTSCTYLDMRFHRREPLDESHASRLSVSGVGHGDMGKPRGRLKVQSISGPSDFWLKHPRFGQEPLPFFAKHPAHPLLGGEGGVVGDAGGCRSLADGLPLDGDDPEDLPRPFAYT